MLENDMGKPQGLSPNNPPHSVAGIGLTMTVVDNRLGGDNNLKKDYCKDLCQICFPSEISSAFT